MHTVYCGHGAMHRFLVRVLFHGLLSSTTLLLDERLSTYFPESLFARGGIKPYNRASAVREERTGYFSVWSPQPSARATDRSLTIE